MGRFVNPDNSAFEAAVSAKYMLIKPVLLVIPTELLIQSMLTFATAGHAVLANR